MVFTVEKADRTLLIVTVLAAALIHVSIAASQVLLGIGIGLMLVTRRRLSFPRIWLPLLIFFLLTLVSLLISPDPWGGHAQIRKFFVFLFIPLIYGVFQRQFSKVYYVLAGWALTASASGVWGLVQFFLKYHHSQVTGEDFYTAYVGARITGFESHWMTFGALQLGVLLFLIAQLFYSERLLPKWAYGSVAILGAAIVLGWTRSIWVAAVPSTFYLFWCWKPKLVWILPVALILIAAFAPGDTRDRLVSFVSPHGDTDSNAHRMVTFRTGARMIKSHPVFGLGPEQISKQFDAYVPADIPRPLPTGFYGHLHNIYLQYAAERGIPAMLVMMWLIGLVLGDCMRALRRAGMARSQERWVLHGAIAFIIAVLVEGLFEFNLGDSEVLMMFVTVIGLAYSAVANVNGQAGDRESVPRSLLHSPAGQ
jgi:putative inorganic carbon (HCO3(-)) transporter